MILNYFCLRKDDKTPNVIFSLAPEKKTLTDRWAQPTSHPPHPARPHTHPHTHRWPSLGRSAEARYPVHGETTRTYSLSSRKQLFTVNNWYKAVTHQLIHMEQAPPRSAAEACRWEGLKGRLPAARFLLCHPHLPTSRFFPLICPSYCQSPHLQPFPTPAPARLPSWRPGSALEGLMSPSASPWPCGAGPGPHQTDGSWALGEQGTHRALHAINRNTLTTSLFPPPITTILILKWWQQRVLPSPLSTCVLLSYAEGISWRAFFFPHLHDVDLSSEFQDTGFSSSTILKY